MRSRGPTWEPTSEDYVQVLSEQNPWHLDGQVPKALAQEVERPLGAQLWRRLVIDKPRRYQLVLGPRRVGKTTCLYQTVRNLLREGVEPLRLWWLRLDHPLLMRVSLETLVLTAQTASKASEEKPVFVFLDELAYAEHWDRWLKTFYDERRPIRLAGSSSATAVLKDRRVESGVGRWEEQYLAPYLFREYLDLVGVRVDVPVASTLAETIDACVDANINLARPSELRHVFMLTGGFPELLLGLKEIADDEQSALLQSQRMLRNDAVERAIYKDIPQAFGIDNPMMLERMLYTLAGQATGVVSPTGICKNLDGLSQPTFDRYLSYLVHAFLVFALPNYSGSEVSRQKRGRKLYFVDGAVRNAALQRGIAPLSDPGEMGVLMENLVAGHLHALSQQTQVRLYHWRDGHDEVDLIYDHPEAPLAFEIASSLRHSRGGFYKLMDRFPRFRGKCFMVLPSIMPSRPAPESNEIGTLPVDLLLLAVSAQAERELAIRQLPTGGAE